MAANESTPKWNDIERWEDILRITNLRHLVALVRELNLDAKGLRDAEQFQNRLLEHWMNTRRDFSIQENEIYSGLKNGVMVQAEVRHKLLDKYDHVQEFYRGLDENVKISLENSFSDVPTLFEEKKNSLATGECTIVVAGEVGSGKSSFINLLLGIDLFPTGPLKCTNTVCEIRASDGAKVAYVFYKPVTAEDGSVVTPKQKKINLESLGGIQNFKDHVTESNDDDENPCERIEVYWPFKMLGKDVVIVDTPGIEGGQNVDQSLNKYLSKAFGFIFMLNTTIAGGVQQTRLGHLLKTIVNNASEFDPGAALFIGNKWELVPDSDKEDIKEDIFAKLKKLYPGVRPNQIHFMSVIKAMSIFMKHKARIVEHTVLLSHIERLIPVCLQQGLISNYGWLSSFLVRTQYLLKVFNADIVHESNDLEEQRGALKDRIQLLRKNADVCIKNLRETVEFNIFKITEAVKKYMTSMEFRERLYDWKEKAECPSPQRKWKTTAYEASIKISSRVTDMLNFWEKDKQVFQTIERDIVERFSKDLGLMENQLAVLEADLIKAKYNEVTHTLRPSPAKRLFRKAKRKIEATYTTLGGAISVVGTLDFSSRETKKIFREYNDRNKSEKMKEGTAVYIKNILECTNLHERLRKFFAKFFSAIDDAAERIPSFLQADEQLIATINMKIRGGTTQREILPELTKQCVRILGDLDTLYVNSIMVFDYQIGGDIKCNFDESFAEGNFAKVFKGFLRKNNQPVALKKNKEIVSKSNVSEILTEDRIMRDLKHVNVIRYYGAAYKRVSKGIEWIMVMELAKGSLRTIYIESDDGPVPGRYPRGDTRRVPAVRVMLSHSRQIAEALEYIHGKGYTHRDMKLENVLVSRDDVIKVTDVGVSKKTDLLLQTCAGSPAYMSPEVLLKTEHQTEKVDIYSMSFVVWEMWYGRDILPEITQAVQGEAPNVDAMELLKKKQGSKHAFRPHFIGANGPPDKMVQMLQRGWDTRPGVRPDAKDFVKLFKELEKSENI